MPELTLSRQFTFSVGYTILPHRAQLGFMVPGKDWGGDARANARSLSFGELVGGGGCNCADDGDWNWGTGLRLRPPSPNKHSGEEGLHWLGRGRASGAERGARDTARSPGDVGLRGGGFQRRLRDSGAGAPELLGCTCP